jgi:hypothetical protein
MGRVGVSGGSISGVPGYTLMDDFSYSGAGTKSLGGGSGNSFSIDDGGTLLMGFNGVAGGDTRDWASGTNDAFNAFSSSGVVNGFTAVDVRAMDVIGWDLVQGGTSVPEPMSLALVLTALGAGGLARRSSVKRVKA